MRTRIADFPREVDGFRQLLAPSGSDGRYCGRRRCLAEARHGLVLTMMNELGFEGVKGALHRGIVEAVGFVAHRARYSQPSAGEI